MRCQARLMTTMSAFEDATGLRPHFSSQPAGARAGAPEGGCGPRDRGATAPLREVAVGMNRPFVVLGWVAHRRGIKGSRGARPPSGAAGCASRPTCQKFHRPAAAFFKSARGGACWGTRGRVRSPRPWRYRAFGEAGMTGFGRSGLGWPRSVFLWRNEE